MEITKTLLEKSVGPPNGVGLESLFTGEAGIYQPSLGSLITDLRGAIPYDMSSVGNSCAEFGLCVLCCVVGMVLKKGSFFVENFRFIVGQCKRGD